MTSSPACRPDDHTLDLIGSKGFAAGGEGEKRPASFTASDANAAVWQGFLRECRFAIGDHIRRPQLRRGVPEFEGKVCGFYSTDIVHVGVVAQSLTHPHETRMFRQDAIELVKAGMDLPR